LTFDQRTVTFALGGGYTENIPEGVEMALVRFKRLEKSRLRLSPLYAFGREGFTAYGIPENAIISYIVTLRDFTKVCYR